MGLSADVTHFNVIIQAPLQNYGVTVVGDEHANARHQACLRVWHAMIALAEDPPWEAKKLIFIQLASKIKNEILA